MSEGGPDNKKIAHFDFKRRKRLSLDEAKRRDLEQQVAKLALDFQTDFIDSLQGRLGQLWMIDQQMSEIERDKTFNALDQEYQYICNQFGNISRAERLRKRMRLKAKGESLAPEALTPEQEEMCREFHAYKKTWLLEVKSFQLMKGEWTTKFSGIAFDLKRLGDKKLAEKINDAWKKLIIAPDFTIPELRPYVIGKFEDYVKEMTK